MIVDCAAYLEDGRCTERLDLDEVGEWVDRPGAFVWLGLRMPGPEEWAEVRRRFGLPAALADDALTPHQRPRFATSGSSLALVLRTASYNDTLERVTFGELSVLAGPGFLVTVRFGQASPLGGVRRQFDEPASDTDRVPGAGPGLALAAVVDRVVEDYVPVLAGLEQDVIEVERDVFSDARRSPARRIYYLKRQVLDLWSVIDALADPLERLVRNRLPWMTPEARERLRDTADHLDRVARRARSLSDLLTSALEANLTQVSVRQNEDMRRISAWVAIAAVPTMVAGVYGMNFEYMPELGWRGGYPLVLAVMAAVCLALYRTFRRSGWL